MSSKKKSRLTDQINSLLSGPGPVGSLEPDEQEPGYIGFSETPGEDDGVPEEDVLPPVRAQEKMRMRADITIDDPRYAGKIVGRKQAQKPREEEEDEDEDEDEDENEDDAALDEQYEEESTDHEDAEAEEIKNVADEIEEQQEANILQLVAVRGGEKEKAQHARNQREITDALLESRIRLQKPLALAARLPRGQAMQVFKSKVENAGSALGETVSEMRGLVDDLLRFRASLWQQNSILPEPNDEWSTPHNEDDGADEDEHEDEDEDEEEGTDVAGVGQKRARRECDRLWHRISQADRDMVPFRDATVDKWNSKVSIAGSGGVGVSKFKALNQSILAQTQQVLQDMERLVRRTRVKRSKYAVLGSQLLPGNEEEEGEGEEEDVQGASEQETTTTGRRSMKEEMDDEAYDDTDFYQLLLRDLLESSATSSSAATDLQAQLRAARRKAGKAGKTVDTKASKGRKLRYDIQPKLVNFMFPVPDDKPAFADALFEHLFKA